MPSFKSTVLAAAVTLVATVHADYFIEPKTVPLSTREAWCVNEKDACPLICQQTKPGSTLVNECDPEKLTYGCLCGNNKQPNVSEYSLTLPYFVCQEWGNQCVTKCGSDNACSSSCREDNPCGATDPKKYNETETESESKTGEATGVSKPTASQTGDEDVVYSSAPGGSEYNSQSGFGDNEGAAAAVEVGSRFGLAIVLTSLFAGFAML